MLSYRFRLYPSRKTKEALFRQLELCKWLYNRLLDELNNAKAKGRRLTQKDTQVLIVKLKTEKPEFKLVYSKVLQMVNCQLWRNIKAFCALKKNGREVGKLRFKGKWFKTLNYNQSGFKLEGKKLILSKVGVIKVKLQRPIKGNIKGVIVKRELSGRWFAVFQVENLFAVLPSMGRVVGLAVGVRHFLSDSVGRQIENPKFYERSLERLRKGHRSLSRKKEGSQNRVKAKRKLACAYEKVVNERDDFLHKLSRFYVTNYDVIVVEDLNITNMVRNRYLAKILDASWSRFLMMLSYKAERAGRTLVKVNPRGTSQEYKHDELDRDYNAALNVLERGLAGLGRPLVSVEVKPLLPVAASDIVEAGSPCEARGSSPLQRIFETEEL